MSDEESPKKESEPDSPSTSSEKKKRKLDTTEKDDSEGSKYIKLKVVGNQEQNGIHFRLKLTTPLLKLKKSYSNHVDAPISSLRFIFDGRRISDDDTPMKLDMKDEDMIEVFQEQTGGLL